MTNATAKARRQRSPIQGEGMVASEAITRGETICVFSGQVLTIHELKARYAAGTERIDDPFQIDDQTYLDLDEPYVFFNHSCDPNAGMRGTGTLFALRDIAPGEEITFDYSTTEWTDDAAWGVPWTEGWSIPCLCGAGACRGEVRVFPLLPQGRKDYYRALGALPDFILRKV